MSYVNPYPGYPDGMTTRDLQYVGEISSPGEDFEDWVEHNCYEFFEKYYDSVNDTVGIEAIGQIIELYKENPDHEGIKEAYNYLCECFVDSEEGQEMLLDGWERSDED